jgi:hypothetical protein
MAKRKKSDADVALEMYESVKQSTNKEKRLKSSTFWSLFHVKKRHPQVVEKITNLLDGQGLNFAVKSGETFGKESDSDWIVLTPKIKPPEPSISPLPLTQLPPPEWFEMMHTRDFESEREVEAFFITPLLEKLGYEYDDIVIGYPVEMFKGVQKTRREADFVIFNGSSRSKEDALLVIEAKKSDKGISVDHIGQAASYAQELLPACYIVSNGQQIIVFKFNGMLAPDERVMDFDRSELKEKWETLYGHISKEATIKRKEWMISQVGQSST